MNRLNFFYTVFFILITELTLFGQHQGTKDISNLKSPYILQISLNYVQPLPDLLVWDKASARSEHIYTGKTFGTDKGFGATIVSKIGLGRQSNLFFTQTLAYNRILSYDYLKNPATFDKGFADYNAYSIGAGMEYYFTLSKKTRLFAGGEVIASLINGETDIYLERSGYALFDTILMFSILSSFRMGYGLNFGSEYMLTENVGLSLGVRLTNLNAFTKSSEGSNNDIRITLRDDDEPGLVFAGKKEFLFYTVGAGVNIHFLPRVKSKKKTVPPN